MEQKKPVHPAGLPHYAFQGSTIATPECAKCLAFRVATVNPLLPAIAPICASGTETVSLAGLPAGTYYIDVYSVDFTPFQYSLTLTSAPRVGPIAMAKRHALA